MLPPQPQWQIFSGIPDMHSRTTNLAHGWLFGLSYNAPSKKREANKMELLVLVACPKVMTPAFSSTLIQSSARTERSSKVNMRGVYKQRGPESKTKW